MKMEEAKIGDFVRLKDDETEMQIVDLEVDLVVCRWLVAENQIRTQGYKPDELALVREGDGKMRFPD